MGPGGGVFWVFWMGADSSRLSVRDRTTVKRGPGSRDPLKETSEAGDLVHLAG